MSGKKTAWHPPFTHMLEQRCPRWITVRGEVQITTEPLRVDDLLEVSAQLPRDPSDTGETLHGMWKHIPRVGLLEFKSPVWPFHHGDLYRLLAYGALWLAKHQVREVRADGTRAARLRPADVTLVLAVPSINAALRDELAALALSPLRSDDGYHRIDAATFPLLIVDLETVAVCEGDDLLWWFAGHPGRTLATQRWVREHQGARSDAMSTQATPDLYGYDEWMDRYAEMLTPEQRLRGLTPEQRLAGIAPEQRLAGIAPEQRLAGIAPEQRLAGLAPEQRLALAAQLTEAEHLLAMPDHLLRMLPDAFIAALPEEVQRAVRARRGG